MLDNLRRMIGGLAGGAGPVRFAPDDHRVAAAALLVHVASIDGVVRASERQRLAALIGERFGTDKADTLRLIAAAEKSESEAADVQEFVDLVRRRLDTEAKSRLIAMMWEMAYADGELHEFEENLIFRVAGLLGVPGERPA